MEFKLHNGSGGLCCKSCGRQDKQLNTYDWLCDVPDAANATARVISATATKFLWKKAI